MTAPGTTGRVLVTGAAGFIGRALVAELARRGIPVNAAARSAITVPAGTRAVRVGDLGPATDWSDALTGCDVVVHCAARVHVMHDTEADPYRAYRIPNVAGTEALASQAAAAGLKRLVFLSSVKVNGERTRAGKPFRHDDPPARVDPYGTSKADAEDALWRIGRATGLEIVAIRPALVYGPGVRANFLSMMRWVARGLPLPFGGVTMNRRAFIAIDNLLDLLITCLRHPGAANQVFLASDGEDLSTSALLRRTATALGVPSRLIPVPVSLLAFAALVLRRPEFKQRLVDSLEIDSSFTRTRLGWTPPVSVDEGLRRASVTLRPPLSRDPHLSS